MKNYVYSFGAGTADGDGTKFFECFRIGFSLVDRTCKEHSLIRRVQTMSSFFKQLNSPGGRIAVLSALVILGMIGGGIGLTDGDHIAIPALAVLLHQLGRNATANK